MDAECDTWVRRDKRACIGVEQQDVSMEVRSACRNRNDWRIEHADQLRKTRPGHAPGPEDENALA